MRLCLVVLHKVERFPWLDGISSAISAHLALNACWIQNLCEFIKQAARNFRALEKLLSWQSFGRCTTCRNVFRGLSDLRTSVPTSYYSHTCMQWVHTACTWTFRGERKKERRWSEWVRNSKLVLINIWLELISLSLVRLSFSIYLPIRT